ncbi:PGPGW domain-containing protein [Dokdonella sp.]|uniref:PGPGW domain-containing protein n=1 Tax=Dokdonella sp. TaxID=2291710 RepID=UPI003C4B9031
MTVTVRRQWEHFSASRAGRRFQTRYRLRRSSRNGPLRKVLISGLGALVMLAGVAMLVLPGPGLLAILIGAVLVAEESLFAARLLDRIDVWISRKIADWRSRRL